MLITPELQYTPKPLDHGTIIYSEFVDVRCRFFGSSGSVGCHDTRDQHQ